MWMTRVREITSSRGFVVVAASVTSLASGLAVGHLATKKYLTEKYEEIANQEIAEAKAFYAAVYDKPDPEDLAAQYDEIPETVPDEVMERAVEALRNYVPNLKMEEPEEEVTLISKNIFAMAPEDFDYEVEVSMRNSVDPYIVTAEEFYQNEDDYEQTQITYFAEDDIFSDGKEAPIVDVENTVGLWASERFGHGSNDPLVVYIRNPRIEMDFEVTKSEGSFAKEVHGIEPRYPRDLKHSSDRIKVRKFRTYDD